MDGLRHHITCSVKISKEQHLDAVLDFKIFNSLNIAFHCFFFGKTCWLDTVNSVSWERKFPLIKLSILCL